MWRNAKYELPTLRLVPYYRYESSVVLIFVHDKPFTARLVQDEEKAYEPEWELLGRDSYTYGLNESVYWRELSLRPVKTRACGNAGCSSSSGNWEDDSADGSSSRPYAMTFGMGELYGNGKWSSPCRSCARDAEERDGVPKNSYWPHEPTED